MHKINQSKGSSSSLSNSDASNQMSRTLFRSLLNGLYHDVSKSFLTVEQPIWTNLIEIGFILEDFMYIQDDEIETQRYWYEKHIKMMSFKNEQWQDQELIEDYLWLLDPLINMQLAP